MSAEQALEITRVQDIYKVHVLQPTKFPHKL